MSNFSILYIILSAFLVSAGVVVHATQTDAIGSDDALSGEFLSEREG